MQATTQLDLFLVLVYWYSFWNDHNLRASTGSTTFSGDLSGDGNFIKDGNYTLTLSGSNSITGTKTINGGTLSISSDDNLGAVPGSVQSGHLVFDGGTLQTTAGFTLNSNRGINLRVMARLILILLHNLTMVGKFRAQILLRMELVLYC